MLTLITLEVITGHCFGKGVGTALCPCQALGKPWDGLCASRTCWDSVVLVAGNADWAGTHHQADSRRVGNRTGSTACTTPRTFS